jgi:hypothetical protein
VILEYRAGVASLPGLADTMARLLEQSTSLRVIAPRDAQRRFGDNLSAQVAQCGGEARCVAALGQRLDADEVLLIGISRLGDVLIALSRVGVAQRAVLAREAESLPAGTQPDHHTVMGYLQALLPAEDFVRFGEIRIRAAVTGALVFINGRQQGTTPLDPLRVPAPSAYDVRVAKPGHVEFNARLDVPPEAVVEVRPELPPLAPAAPWYRRWWVWAIAGGVVAGTSILLAAGTGGPPERVDVLLQPPR